MADPLEHVDIVRIVGQSHDSFDDAVQRALTQLVKPASGHDHHPGYKITDFEVVKLTGKVHHDEDAKSAMVTHYSATLDVTAVHKH